MSDSRYTRIPITDSNFEAIGAVFNTAGWPLKARMTDVGEARLRRFAEGAAREQFPGRTVRLERDDPDASGDVAAAGNDDDAREQRPGEAPEVV